LDLKSTDEDPIGLVVVDSDEDERLDPQVLRSQINTVNLLLTKALSRLRRDLENLSYELAMLLEINL